MKSRIPAVLQQEGTTILEAWMKEQGSVSKQRESELRQNCQHFFAALKAATQKGNLESVDGPEWDEAKQVLSALSRSRGQAGATPSETAMFVLSLKKPLFQALRVDAGNSADALFEDVWVATTILDKLGLFTTDLHQKAREEVINRQQMEMLELSTPVVKLWDGILALPMIGTLDSNRTQVVMETLLRRIVETNCRIAILDITGVPTVDTLVAQHLLKTVAAARLMGAECIISGIRPQIAQTIVHLGVDLSSVATKASLADAFQLALRRSGSQLSHGSTEAAKTTSPFAR